MSAQNLVGIKPRTKDMGIVPTQSIESDSWSTQSGHAHHPESHVRNSLKRRRQNDVSPNEDCDHPTENGRQVDYSSNSWSSWNRHRSPRGKYVQPEPPVEIWSNDRESKSTPSDESGLESEVPPYEEVGDSLDVDWQYFMLDDVMLPPTNYEAGFAKLLDTLDYRGLASDENNSTYTETEAPWHPYDPDVSQEMSNIDEEAGDEQDNFLSNPSDMPKAVCFGAIHKTGVQILSQAISPLTLLLSAQSASKTFRNQKICLFKILPDSNGSGYLLLQPDLEDGNIQAKDHIAVLNKRVCLVLAELAVRSCFFEAYSDSGEWAKIVNGVNPIGKDTHTFTDIVLYGPTESAAEVGALLDSREVFLQEPDYRDPRLGYSNPHFLDLSTIDMGPEEACGDSRHSHLQLDLEIPHKPLSEQATTQAMLQQKVAMAFKGTTRAHNLQRIVASSRICTPLKTYQEEALDFVRQRETGPVSEQYSLWNSRSIGKDTLYTHKITGCEKNEIPHETGGGILADEMGLGKTLTMLAAILATADDAKQYSANTYRSAYLAAESFLNPARATLVVAPSPLLLREWQREIKTHCTGFDNVVVYHGHGREGNEKVLADADIVLSTYQTIAHEYSDTTSPLWQIQWFRIILDEAHIIRRMSTKLFKAMKKLHAKYLWCLTGTPVQNSIEDLAALISFIGAAPLDNLAMFRTFISKPLLKNSGTGVENLRQLLDSICLRRTNELLELPNCILDDQFLRFSTKEAEQYGRTRDKLIALIKKSSLQPKEKRKGYLGVFQLQLQLRRFCNHGTFQRLSLGAEEFDPEQAIAHLKKQKDAKCQVCTTRITGIQGIEEKRSGNFTVCGHLICVKCEPEVKSNLRGIPGRVGYFKCSLCPEEVLESYIVKPDTSPKPSKFGTRNLSALQYFDKDGCSTKVSALVADIKCNLNMDSKSIVFSCWTRSLDLVGIFLAHHKVPFVRIDGSHTIVQRKQILDLYHSDTNVKILLMTTGTGAIGLNLTIANTVYLLEPQWNPMVENQAVARVLRLGQKKPVRVVRYIMKDTVELELRSQQTMKLEYARAGWKPGQNASETEGLSNQC